MALLENLRSGIVEKLRHHKVTPAVAYYFINRTSQLVTILVTIVLITTHFSPTLQGYYYTLLSLMAFQVLADFGLANVLMQFVSHEWPHLKFENGDVVGDHIARARFASLVRLAFISMALIATSVMVLLWVIGYFFIKYSHPESTIDWEMPWFGACLGVALGMAGTILSSINMGCDQVAQSQRAAAISTAVSNVAGWAAILAGWGLHTLSIQRVLAGVILIGLLLRDIWPAIKLLRLPPSEHRITWRGDFWRQQWRIGISWLAGIGIYQSFVPIIFRLVNPVVAGQAGLLLQAYTFVNILSASWMSAVQPQFGQFWATQDRVGLTALVANTQRKTMISALFFGALVILMLTVLTIFLPHYATRFGTLPQVFVLMASCIVVQILNVQSSAVRFSKSEPYLVLCLVHAALIVTLNIILAPLGVVYMYLSFFLVLVIVVTPWSDHIYFRYTGGHWTDAYPRLQAAVIALKKRAVKLN